MALSTRELYLIIRARDEASRVLRGLAGNMNHLTRQEQLAAQQSMMRGQALIGMGAAIGLTGAAGLKFFKDSTMAAVEYNRQAALTKTQVDNVHVSVKRLEDVGRSVASNIAVPFDTIQSSLYDIFSSLDVNVPQSKHLLEAFSKTAVAGQVDLQEASRASIAILNAFKLKTSEVGHVEDVMFQLVRKGVGTYGEFATTIGQAIPSARNAGQSIEGLAGMLAFLTRNGLSASRASTSAARALDTLTNAGTIQRFHKLGIEVHDAAGNFRPVAEIATELGQKLAGLTDTQRSKKLAALFTGSGYSIQARRFWNLAIRNYSQLDSLTGSMVHSTGALNSAYKTMSNTPAAQAQLLSNRFKVLRTEIGDALIPVFLKLVSALGAVVNWFSDLSPSTKRWIAIIGALVSAMMLLMGIVTALAGLFLMFQGAATLAGMSLATFAATLGGVGIAMIALTAITVALVAGMVNAHEEAKAFNDGLSKIAHTQDWTVAQQAMTDTTDKLNRLEGSWANAFSFGGDKLGKWLTTINAVNRNVEQLANDSGQSQSAMYLLARAAGVNLAGSFTEVNSGIKDYLANIRMMSGGNKTMEYDMIQIGAAVNTATDKINAFRQAFDFLIGLNVDTRKALADTKSTIDTVTKSLVKQGAAYSVNSKQGRANISNITELKNRAEDYANSVYMKVLRATNDATYASEVATKAFWGQIEAFRKNAEAAGISKGAIDKLLHSLGLIPPKKQTEILTPGLAQASQGVWDLVHGLGQIKSKYSTKVFIHDVLSGPLPKGRQDSTPNGLGGLLGNAIPHNHRRALGGDILAKQVYLVGEHGPELFVSTIPGKIVPDARKHMSAGQYEGGATAGGHAGLGKLYQQVSAQLNALRSQISGLGNAKKVQKQLTGLRKERDALATEQSALATAQRALDGSTARDTKAIDALRVALNKLKAAGQGGGVAADTIRKMIDKLNAQRLRLEASGIALRKTVVTVFDESVSPLATHLSTLAKKIEDSATNATGKMPRAVRRLVNTMKAQSAAVADEWSSMQSMQAPVTSIVDAFGGGVAVDRSSVLRYLHQQLRIFRKWARNVHKLAKKGLNRVMLRDIINAGPDSEALVEALLGGGMIDQVNSALSEANKVEQHYDTQFERDLFRKNQHTGSSRSHRGGSDGRHAHHQRASTHHGGRAATTVNFTQNITTQEVDPRKLAADAGHEIARYV